MAEKIVIALGGNAILQPGQESSYENQLKNVEKSAKIISDIIKAGCRVVVTHGNGPQVGNILRQNEVAKEIVPPLPLHVCSAESQGFIGYMMDQSLKNQIALHGLGKHVVSILTQTEVAQDDPAFKDPTKPIGVFYSEMEAKQLAAEKGWVVKEDAGRGYRRVVASPVPQRILGFDAIKLLIEHDVIVIASGGGGIPVFRDEHNQYQGVEAVVDKDLSGVKLAIDVEADTFMILTDVDNVFVHYGEPEQLALKHITVAEAEAYVAEQHFAVGSMGPKMHAAITFAKNGGKSIICSLDQAVLARQGKAGTHITA